MQIAVSHPWIYYSTLPGVKSLLPQTLWQVQVFPAFLLLEDPKTGFAIKVHFSLKGPLKDFLVSLNLERGFIEVQGFAEEGFFRYRIVRNEQTIEIHFDKGFSPIEYRYELNFAIDVQEEKNLLQFPIEDLPPFTLKQPLEVLFLGESKKQDIDLMRRRKNLLEILPLWLRMSYFIPEIVPHSHGLCRLVDKALHLVGKKEKALLEKELFAIAEVGFTDLFLPRLVDVDHLGVCEHHNEQIPQDAEKACLISRGAELIRSLFFQQKKNLFSILPCLPFSCISGRFVNLECDTLGFLSIEWSKGLIKKMVFTARKDFTLELHLQKEIQSFRLKSAKKQKGQIFGRDDKIAIEASYTYFFDHFQK